ncbi:unnamed protein product [Orchesella dallaii]|uniref:Uncharacterized protein n=1 Tax=Orchesella dallaii TaxID=48710 RepID=A0ABP1Q6F6_9HEXA
MPDFYHEHFRRRSGKNMTFVAPHISNNCSSNGTLIRKQTEVPNNINKIRQKRGIVGRMKRGFMGFFNPRFDKTAYLNKRQLELETTNNQARQFNIAEEIAARIRSPRQCRLLNWFGSNNDNKNTNTPVQQGMTTTITTFTNTGGMMGNGMERLSGTIPQAAVNAGGMGNSGSQVVTVIQQTPPGAAASNNLMSQLSGSVGTTTSNIPSGASTFGSTICPFNTQELQELIIKAQTIPFPHFLTTTTPTPTRAVPLSTSTAGTTTTTTQKATQAPPPPATTLAVVVRQSPGNSRHSPQNYVNFYGNFNPPLRPIPTPFISRKPHAQLVPTIGNAGEDDEGDFYNDPHVTYERINVMDKFHTHTLRHKSKKAPKWMTTTEAPQDDDYYTFSDAVLNYSYGIQGGYKVEPKQIVPARYIREPPVVIDSGTRYQPEAHKRARIQVSKATSVPTPPSKKKSVPQKHTESTEESDEKDDGSSDEGSDGDDDGSDEEASSTSSDSTENRSNVKNIKEMQRQFSNPQQSVPPSPRRVEASDEDDNSNEAEETKDNEDDEEDSEEDEEHHSLRSFERSDFSKDRGGPPPTSVKTTQKPSYQENNNVGTSSGVTGLLSNFLNSFNPLNSIFRRDTKKVLPYASQSLTAIPQRLTLISDETEDYDENEEESEEDSEDEGNKVNYERHPSSPDTPISSFYPWSARQLSSTTVETSTAAPITIEDSGSWAERYKGSAISGNQRFKGDDSEEDGVFDNPVEKYQRVSRRKLPIRNSIFN